MSGTNCVDIYHLLIIKQWGKEAMKLTFRVKTPIAVFLYFLIHMYLHCIGVIKYLLIKWNKTSSFKMRGKNEKRNYISCVKLFSKQEMDE